MYFGGASAKKMRLTIHDSELVKRHYTRAQSVVWVQIKHPDLERWHDTMRFMHGLSAVHSTAVALIHTMRLPYWYLNQTILCRAPPESIRVV